MAALESERRGGATWSRVLACPELDGLIIVAKDCVIVDWSTLALEPLPMTRPRRLRTDSVQSPLETYLREINETPLLNAEDEKIRQRAVEKVTEMRYKGAAVLSDGPQPIVIDIDSAVARRAAEGARK